MIDSSDAEVLTIRITQRKLWIMFIAGFWLDVVLVFVPAYTARVGGFLGIGGEERSFSPFELIRLAFASGRDGWGLLDVVWFCSMLTFGVLGLKHPRRWVFLSGACVASFFLVLNFFCGLSPGWRPYFLPQMLGLAASGMEIGGFWIKPTQATNEVPEGPLRIFPV